MVASHVPPDWGSGPQPRHVPKLGIEPLTPGFAGTHPIHWTTTARAALLILYPEMLLWDALWREGVRLDRQGNIMF